MWSILENATRQLATYEIYTAKKIQRIYNKKTSMRKSIARKQGGWISNNVTFLHKKCPRVKRFSAG